MQVNGSCSLDVTLLVKRFHSSSNRISRGRVWTPGSKNNHLPSTGSLGAGHQPIITSLSSTEGGRANERFEGESKFLSPLVLCRWSVFRWRFSPRVSFIGVWWVGRETSGDRRVGFVTFCSITGLQRNRYMHTHTHTQTGRSELEVQMATVLSRRTI